MDFDNELVFVVGEELLFSGDYGEAMENVHLFLFVWNIGVSFG